MTSSAQLRRALDLAISGLREARESMEPGLQPREVGVIANISTGIATVVGLPGVGFEELVSFRNGLLGIAFNVDEFEIGVVLLGDNQGLQAGDELVGLGVHR